MAADAHTGGQQAQSEYRNDVEGHSTLGIFPFLMTAISDQQRGKGQSSQNGNDHDFHKFLLVSGGAKFL